MHPGCSPVNVLGKWLPLSQLTLISPLANWLWINLA